MLWHIDVIFVHVCSLTVTEKKKKKGNLDSELCRSVFPVGVTMRKSEAPAAFLPTLTPDVPNLHGCFALHTVVAACTGQSSARWLLVMKA